MEPSDKPTKYVSMEGIEVCDSNPFLPELVDELGGKVKMRNDGKIIRGPNGFVTNQIGLHDLVTGEILEGETLVLGKKKAVDTEEFVKVYVRGAAIIRNLSKRATEVLTVLIETYTTGVLQGTNDLIFFTHEEAQGCGYKKGWHTFRSGMNELAHAQFLVPAKKGHGWYWINPSLFYRGNRVLLIEQYDLTAVKRPESKRAIGGHAKGDPVLDQVGLFSGTTPRDEVEHD